MLLVSVFLITGSLCILPVEQSSEWNRFISKSKLLEWDDIVKAMRKHHLHYDQWQFRLHTSASTSSSSEMSSKSRSKSPFSLLNKKRKKEESKSSRRRKQPHHQSRSQSDSHQEDIEQLGSEIEEKNKPLVAQALMFFVTNWGCSNVTGFQHFFAAYNTEAAEDRVITMNDHHELLNEMSNLAQKELGEEKLRRPTILSK